MSPPKNPILEALMAAMSSGPAQKRQDEFYNPRPQTYWHHDGSSWIDANVSPLPTVPASLTSSTIRLISWNIDILVPFIEERMSAALAHLSGLVSQTDSSTPIVIYLQEMGQSDIAQIREASWVQERFYITDLDHRNWLNPLYGTTMLVDKRFKIASVFRVPYISKFDRDGLFVDIDLGEKVLRLCNCHMESLVADPPVRPLQLEAAAKYLKEDKVAAALLAGDLNAIQPFDRTLHSDNGMRDAYLELGGKEDSDDGYTWGHQVPQEMKDKFGCSRMDKILYRGAIEAKSFERIGAGVKVAEEHRKAVRDAGELEWVTDHYGVTGDFELTGIRPVAKLS